MTGRRRSDRRARTAAAAAAGFTLLELMFALTIGSIALTAIYTVVGGSTRVFHEQHRLSGMQTSVRRAMSVITRDIQRAGFLSTPSARAQGETCNNPSGVSAPLIDSVAAGARFAAIAYWAEEPLGLFPNTPMPEQPWAGNAVPNAANRHDVLTLLANYETNAQYAGAALVPGVPNRLYVEPTWHAFERDFTNWATVDPGAVAFAVDQTALTEAFWPGRAIRILTNSGKKHFARIDGVDMGPQCLNQGRPWEPICIRFNPAVPQACRADASKAHVAPVSFIRYHLQQSVDVGQRLGTGVEEEVVTGPNIQLRRTEMDPTNPAAPLPVLLGTNDTVLLDFASMFNVVFLRNLQQGPGLPDVVDRTIPFDPMNGGQPEWVRSVVVEIAARSPVQDPRFPWDPMGADPVSMFRVFTDRGGAARVRYQRAEVFVPNVALGGF